MYKYRRYHPIFGNNQHGWFFTHMCGFYPTSEYIVDIWKKTHMCGFYQTLQQVCVVWKKTHMCGFYHTHGISCTFEYWKFGKYAA